MALLAPELHAGGAVGAARLSSVEGQVRVAQGGQLLADSALVNTPLFEGTQVLTAEDGQAELQFDDGSVARLAPNSSLTLAFLRGQAGSGDAEILLQSGLGYFELHGAGEAKPIRIRFSDSVVTVSGFTVLRVNLDKPPGELAVISGNAHLQRGSSGSGAGLALDLYGGESVTLSSADLTQYILSGSIEPDSWDAWNSDRDQALAALAATRTGAANSLPGNNNPAWNDLDANGNWYNLPEQGYVWSPYEAASPDWDPYGSGNWMWTQDYGYVWVSGNSWGYMPYQCGAWNYYSDFGWGWSPSAGIPWWGGGAWLSNIGNGPPGYHPPRRPHPVAPHEPVGHPLNGGLAAPLNPVVAVNRRPPGGTAAAPARNRNSVATIAGQVVEPLRPVSPRPQYDRLGYAGRSQPAYAGAWTPAGQRSTGFVPGGSGRAAGLSSGRTASAPTARTYGGSARPSAPSRSYSGRGLSSGRSYGGGGGGGGSRGGGGHR
jgi:uncharacterized membrane protein YgcG